MKQKLGCILLLNCLLALASSNRFEESDLITNLDDYPVGDYQMYSGYLGYQSVNYHYLHIESKEENAPLLVWINSGSGCSSLVNFFYENGPFFYDQSLKKFVNNPFSLVKKYNVLYLDSPVNYGFSSVDSSFYSSDLQASEVNYNLLLQFLIKYPLLVNSDLIIGSTEFGAIQASYLANFIKNKSISTGDLKLRLKAIFLGNPNLSIKSKADLLNQAYDYAFTRNLYPLTYRKSYLENCRDNLKVSECNLILEQINDLIKFANLKNLYYPCSLNNDKIDDILNKCKDNDDAINFFNKKSVKEGLHVSVDSIWNACNPLVDQFYKTGKESLLYLKNVVLSGVKLYIYVHDSNAASTVTSVISQIDSLELNLTYSWSDWTITSNNISFTKGYTRRYTNLSIFTMLSSGYSRSDRAQLVLEIASKLIAEIKA